MRERVATGRRNAGDLRWWLAVFGGVLLVAAALHATAFRGVPPGTVFSGFLLNSGDAWGYRAFTRAFAEGGWLIDNVSSDTPREPAFFNLVWFALGKVKRLTGLPFLPIYYAFGAAAAGLMFWVILRFCREFAGEGAAGRFAFMLASFGGGFGWLVVVASKDLTVRWRPVDIFIQEGFPLQSALFMPHFALSIAMMGVLMHWFYRGVETGRRTALWLAGLMTLALGFSHPYHLLTVGLVTGAWVVVEQAIDRSRIHRGWSGLGILALAVLPAAAYYLWFFRQPNWRVWASENVAPTGGFPAVAIGLGPLIGLAAVGTWCRGRGHIERRQRFLVVWIAVGLALLFSGPVFRFEGKLIEGLVLPLASLGAGAWSGPGGIVSRRKWAAAAVVLALLLPSHAVLAGKGLRLAAGRDEGFLPENWSHGTLLGRGEAEAYVWLARNPLPGARFMCLLETGRMLPGVADVRVFIGGYTVVDNFARRMQIVKDYYDGADTAAARLDILRRAGITHVWYGPRWGLRFRAADEPYLERIYANADVEIHRVRPAEP